MYWTKANIDFKYITVLLNWHDWVQICVTTPVDTADLMNFGFLIGIYVRHTSHIFMLWKGTNIDHCSLAHLTIPKVTFTLSSFYVLNYDIKGHIQ